MLYDVVQLKAKQIQRLPVGPHRKEQYRDSVVSVFIFYVCVGEKTIGGGGGGRGDGGGGSCSGDGGGGGGDSSSTSGGRRQQH